MIRKHNRVIYTRFDGTQAAGVVTRTSPSHSTVYIRGAWFHVAAPVYAVALIGSE